MRFGSGSQGGAELPQRSGIGATAVALAASGVLLAAGLWLATYLDRTYQARRLAAVAAQAQILAATTTAALDFNDRPTAEEYLQALRANQAIAAAALYDAGGRMFVSYPGPAPPDSLPARLKGAVARRSGRLMNVTAPVSEKGMRLGTVLLQIPTETLAQRAQRYGVAALLLSMAALLVAALGVMQLALRRAYAALAARADQLASVNSDMQAEMLRREAAEAALRQAQKMEAVGQLTGGIAHDFNNLLQIVLASLDRMRSRAARRGLETDPEVERMIGAATQGAQRAATLTQRLLAFSRRQPLNPRPIDLNALVMNMTNLLARTMGEKVAIETRTQGDPWPVLADENQLENALLNLAVNARDAMPLGGTLRIETANVTLTEADLADADGSAPGDFVRLTVSDTGSGMPPDVVARVFEPFFTTKGIGRGTGLGLSQVYGFIHQSGGHVEISSTVDVGTVIALHLPRLMAGSETEAEVRQDESTPGMGAGECVLVVEDEPQVRVLTAESLRELGYTVVEAGVAEEALEVLARSPTVVLMFTDLGLPGSMNGRDLAMRAQALYPALRVLFTTGYALDTMMQEGRLDTHIQLVGKPFSTAELARRVRDILDQA